MRNAPVLLTLTGLAKAYDGVRALEGVSFDLRAGEVHALVGENGAGKSTLIKAITGAIAPDAGTMAIAGREVGWMTPHAAAAAGIVAVYQQPALFPDLTVAENIALRVEAGRSWRLVDWRARRATAAALLAGLGSRIDPDRSVESLSMPEQQIVEIACVTGRRDAAGAPPRIVIMDEPTASLGDREVQSLFTAIGGLKTQGAGVIYISHRLDEIFALADRITVLRDGESVGTLGAAEVTRADLVRLMAGRVLATEYTEGTEARLATDNTDYAETGLGGEGPEARLAADNTDYAEPGNGDRASRKVLVALDRVGHRDSGVRDVSLTIRRGEVLGLAGLVGSGRTELAEILFGLRPADAGTITIDGSAVRISSPERAIARGIAYVPEDRRRHGVVLDLSVAANASLATLRAVSRRGLIDRRAERALAASFVERLRIKAPSIAVPAGALSGGNQQKVALARWLATNPSLLILDEPTQGVDVGAKAEIHRLIAQLAGAGLAILAISSELPEMLSVSHRIAVMHAGTIAGVLDRAGATQDAILHLALGHGVAGVRK